jgi:hypothetical protein
MTRHPDDWADDRTPYPRRRPVRPRGCGGFAAYEGPCGATDCPTCHPEYQTWCPECGWRGYAEDGRCPSCGAGGDEG